MSLPPLTTRRLKLGRFELERRRPLIMGIVNVTPDSFSDGGLFRDSQRAIAHARQLIADGAEILDIGGESTRPGADNVSDKDELERVLPVIQALVEDASVPISIDTRKASVAKECLAAGADIVNDIMGGQDPAMFPVVGQSQASFVLMHIRGTPATMMQHTDYSELLPDIASWLKAQTAKAKDAGVDTVIVDPGIGFAKTGPQNNQILGQLKAFEGIGDGLLVGPSRKSFIGHITGQKLAAERLEGTLAAVLLCALQNTDIVRVHDVLPVKRALQVTEAILDA